MYLFLKSSFQSNSSVWTMSAEVCPAASLSSSRMTTASLTLLNHIRRLKRPASPLLITGENKNCNAAFLFLTAAPSSSLFDAWVLWSGFLQLTVTHTHTHTHGGKPTKTHSKSNSLTYSAIVSDSMTAGSVEQRRQAAWRGEDTSSRGRMDIVSATSSGVIKGKGISGLGKWLIRMIVTWAGELRPYSAEATGRSEYTMKSAELDEAERRTSANRGLWCRW